MAWNGSYNPLIIKGDGRERGQRGQGRKDGHRQRRGGEERELIRNRGGSVTKYFPSRAVGIMNTRAGVLREISQKCPYK